MEWFCTTVLFWYKSPLLVAFGHFYIIVNFDTFSAFGLFLLISKHFSYFLDIWRSFDCFFAFLHYVAIMVPFTYVLTFCDFFHIFRTFWNTLWCFGMFLYVSIYHQFFHILTHFGFFWKNFHIMVDIGN